MNTKHPNTFEGFFNDTISLHHHQRANTMIRRYLKTTQVSTHSQSGFHTQPPSVNLYCETQPGRPQKRGSFKIVQSIFQTSYPMLCIGFCLMLWPGLMQALEVSFSFDGSSGNESQWPPDQSFQGVDVGNILRGNGVNPTSAKGAFSGSDWSRSGLDGNDFFSFSLQPNPGYRLGIDTLQWEERRSLTGIGAWSLRSSLDGFTTDVVAPFQVPDDSLVRTHAISLPQSQFGELTEEIAFRIYGYEAESARGTWRLDNVQLTGSLTAVPEPEAIQLVTGSLLCLVFIYRRWTSHHLRRDVIPH